MKSRTVTVSVDVIRGAASSATAVETPSPRMSVTEPASDAPTPASTTDESTAEASLVEASGEIATSREAPGRLPPVAPQAVAPTQRANAEARAARPLRGPRATTRPVVGTRLCNGEPAASSFDGRAWEGARP